MKNSKYTRTIATDIRNYVVTVWNINKKERGCVHDVEFDAKIDWYDNIEKQFHSRTTNNLLARNCGCDESSILSRIGEILYNKITEDIEGWTKFIKKC